MGNIISIILIIGALGLTFGYTSPLYRGTTGSNDFNDKSVKELKEEKSRYIAALEKTRELEEVRGGLLTKYNSITEIDRKKLDKILPDTVDSVRLIIDMSNIASSYGMQLRNISISESASQVARKDSLSLLGSKLYSSIDLGFSVSGSYDNLVSFISDLEKNLRITDITRLSIRGEDGAVSGESQIKKVGSAGNYSMQISAKTYYLISK